MRGGGNRLPTAVVWGVLAVALVVGAWLRLQGIDRSLTHDEVFTLVSFASKPWSAIASSYEAPNNHILHTFCVKLSAALFDSSDWAIRLPAAAAGMAASFLLVRALTGTAVAALVAVVLMAFCQGQVSASFQAGGYTLFTLMSMLYTYCTCRALDSPRRWRWWVGQPPSVSPQRSPCPAGSIWCRQCCCGRLAVSSCATFAQPVDPYRPDRRR